MTSITVLLATHNGAATLPRVLEGYGAFRDVAGWELIVVDNASTDRTSAILCSFRTALPITVLSAPSPGKNKALNIGLEAADGDLVVFTDDDSIPSRGFVDAWRSVALNTPDAALFGGRIEPVFETSHPSWLLEDSRWSSMLLVTRDLEEGASKWDRIYGPNMAIRRCILDDGLRFDERIGPNSADRLYPMGSESDFLLRAERLGANSWFSRSPHVRHIIRARQLQPRYWAQRAYRSGKGRAFLLANHPATFVHRMMEVEQAHSRIGFGKWLGTVLAQGSRRFRKICTYHFCRGLCDGWALYGGGAASRAGFGSR